MIPPIPRPNPILDDYPYKGSKTMQIPGHPRDRSVDPPVPGYGRLDVLAMAVMIGAIVIIGIMVAMAIASVTQPWPGCTAHPNTILGAIINGCV